MLRCARQKIIYYLVTLDRGSGSNYSCKSRILEFHYIHMSLYPQDFKIFACCTREDVRKYINTTSTTYLN
jgi:hypothetical protein